MSESGRGLNSHGQFGDGTMADRWQAVRYADDGLLRDTDLGRVAAGGYIAERSRYGSRWCLALDSRRMIANYQNPVDVV